MATVLVVDDEFGIVDVLETILTDEGYRRDAQMRCQRAVRAHDAERAIVDDDIVADGVDVFDPLPLGALQLRKSAEVLKRESGVTGERVQEMAFAFDSQGAQVIVNDPFIDHDEHAGTRWTFLPLSTEVLV